MTNVNRHTRSTPVLTDNSMNVAFAIKDFIYCLFGISGVIVAVPSVSEVAGEIAAVALAGTVAISAGIAGTAALLGGRRFRWQKVEFYSTIVMLSFVTMYSVALFILAFSGSESRINVAIIAMAFVVMPAWRLLFLYRNQKT